METLLALQPLVTVIIGLIAAVTAVIALLTQRNIARRRTAIDFFLKTETEEKLIDAYNDFKSLVPDIPVIAARANLRYGDPDHRKIRKWLNLCELISVGVNLKAFSNKVSVDYWADVIKEAYESSLPLIQRIRTTPHLGSANTLIQLELLYSRWRKRGLI